MGHEQRRLKFPPPVENDGKYMRSEEQYKGNIREGWWSVCNASEDMCMTVACFSDLTESVDFNLNKKDGHGYLTPQSFFAVDPAKTITWTIYLFPDKYDGVVAGKTVRDWVYELAPADFKGERRRRIDVVGFTLSATRFASDPARGSPRKNRAPRTA